MSFRKTLLLVTSHIILFLCPLQAMESPSKKSITERLCSEGAQDFEKWGAPLVERKILEAQTSGILNLGLILKETKMSYKINLILKLAAEWCPHIHTLFLNNNDHDIIPTAIEKLTKLEHLDLSNNQLIALPNSICTLISLKTINLADNPTFTHLPKNFYQLVNLETIDISHNTALTQLPVDFRSLIKLKYVFSSGTVLENFSELQHIENLSIIL